MRLFVSAYFIMNAISPLSFSLPLSLSLSLPLSLSVSLSLSALSFSPSLSVCLSLSLSLAILYYLIYINITQSVPGINIEEIVENILQDNIKQS